MDGKPQGPRRGARWAFVANNRHRLTRTGPLAFSRKSLGGLVHGTLRLPEERAVFDGLEAEL